MGKREEEIKYAEGALNDSKEQRALLQKDLEKAELRVKEAQAQLDWAMKSPVERARVLAIIALEDAMKEDKKIGTETYQQIISALKEEVPESKLAIVLDVLLNAIVLDEGKE